MRREKCTPRRLWIVPWRGKAWLLLLAPLLLASPARGQGGQRIISPENEMTRKVNYDEVVQDLIRNLTKSRAEAMDAALKLSRMGKRAVPPLAKILKESKNKQARLFAVLALSRVRHRSAAQVLLPILKDEQAERNMRLMAIGAVGAGGLDAAIGPLQKVARKDPDADLRFKALLALSVMPNAWAKCEALYVKGLSDDRDDIRTLSAKVCHQTAAVKIYYRSAEAKLMELAEKDRVVPVRCNAMAALARMKSRLAVKTFMQVLGDENAPQAVRKQALNACKMTTGVPFRDAAAAQHWWKTHGQARYANAKPLFNPAALEKTKVQKKPKD